MASAPSILLLDDGELIRVLHVLGRMGVGFEHRTGLAAEEAVPQPRHLLVCSAPRAKLVPQLEAPDGECLEPIRVCVHTQDFLPMRRQLKQLGFHYLVHSQLEREVMRLFFLQLLYRGGERRLNPRLPMMCELRYSVAGNLHKGRLEELSREGCRLFSAEEALVGADAVVKLPPQLARGEELELTGHVAHCSPEAKQSGGAGFSVIVVFSDLEAEAQAQIESILAGNDLGTRITPLEPLPHSLGEPRSDGTVLELTDLADEDRRVHQRHELARRLTVLHADASDVLLGRDLSSMGIRIQRDPALSLGDRVAIALYPDQRGEPMILDAEVVREDADWLGLRFVSLSQEQTLRLQQMLVRMQPLESLASDRVEGERLVVAKIVRATPRSGESGP